MWQRFTMAARSAVLCAKEEAQRHGQTLVDTEHMFLGLLRDRQAAAAKVLEHLSVSPNVVVEAIEMAASTERPGSDQEVALSPRCKRVIDLAYVSARDLGNDYIGTEHLLWGLVKEGDGIAGRTLAKLGVKKEEVSHAISELSEG